MSKTVHIVRRGDTVYSIARKYGVSVKVLMSYNNIRNERALREGQRIVIPVINPAPPKGVFAGFDSFHLSGKPARIKTPKVTQKPKVKSNPFTAKNFAVVKPSTDVKKPITIVNTNYTTAQIKDKIRAEARKQGVDENLALAVVEQESNFKPLALGKSGDIGLFQLTKPAIKQVNGEKTFDVDKNIEYGIKYLKWCLNNTKTKEEALVAYNRGLGAIKKAKREGVAIDSVTAKGCYAKTVLKRYERIKNT